MVIRIGKLDGSQYWIGKDSFSVFEVLEILEKKADIYFNEKESWKN